MIRRYVHIMLIFGILFFGCVSETPEQPSQTFACPGGSNVSTPDDCPPGEEAPINLEGKGFDELVELAIPIECNVTFKNDSSKFNSSLYVKGQQFKLTFFTDESSSEMSKNTFIRRSDAYTYYKIESPYPAPESGITMEWVLLASTGGKCDSFKLNESEIEESSYLGNASLKCVVSSFNDELFVTDWKSCTDDEIRGAILTDDSIEENVQVIADRLNESLPEKN